MEAKEADTDTSEVQSLKVLVENLSAQVSELSASQQSTWKRKNTVRGCDSCRKDGTGSKCRHCYKCGELGTHISRNCPKNC